MAEKFFIWPEVTSPRELLELKLKTLTAEIQEIERFNDDDAKRIACRSAKLNDLRYEREMYMTAINTVARPRLKVVKSGSDDAA